MKSVKLGTQSCNVFFFLKRIVIILLNMIACDVFI